MELSGTPFAKEFPQYKEISLHKLKRLMYGYITPYGFGRSIQYSTTTDDKIAFPNPLPDKTPPNPIIQDSDKNLTLREEDITSENLDLLLHYVISNTDITDEGLKSLEITKEKLNNFLFFKTPLSYNIGYELECYLSENQNN